MITQIKLKYFEGEAEIRRSFYISNNRPAIGIFDAHDGSQLLIATRNLADLPCDEDQAWFPHYAENRGVVEELQRLNVIGPILDTHIGPNDTDFTRHPILIPETE